MTGFGYIFGIAFGLLILLVIASLVKGIPGVILGWMASMAWTLGCLKADGWK